VQPVQVWAALGVLFLALELYVFTSWITSGEATPTPAGPDSVPRLTVVVARLWELQVVVAVVACVYLVFVRHWRRERRLSADALMCLGALLVVWQDPAEFYTQPWMTFNPAFVNFGSWAGKIPGTLNPNAHLFAEPILVAPGFYFAMILACAAFANAIMRRAKTYCPNLGWLGLFTVPFCVLCVVNLLVEVLAARLEVLAYPGAIRSLSIFPGSRYQVPLYQVALMSGAMTAFAFLRYFRDEHGRTVAEGGLDQLGLTARAKTVVRVFALGGILNVVMLAVYMVPINWFGLHADPWPTEILQRSYLTNGICGPGTSYSCPGPGVPIPRSDSAHIGPKGELVVPSGVKQPYGP
jgi:hypothetical protein